MSKVIDFLSCYLVGVLWFCVQSMKDIIDKLNFIKIKWLKELEDKQQPWRKYLVKGYYPKYTNN